MQHITDPKSGNELSVLGLGCMRFPRDREQTEKLVVEAVAGGINYFDTAYIYGNSEVKLGAALKKHNLRSAIYLATKLPHQKCKTKEDFERIFNEQLQRLETDYIDYYLIHNLTDVASWNRLREIGIESWIGEKKSSGQVRQIGFSFHGSQSSFMELLDIYDWDFCQIQYNYMDENYQAGRAGLKRAHEKGLPVIIMEPLLGGKLATGLPAKALKILRDADANRSPASWALRWLWDQPEVSVVLSGMNSLEQLSDNLITASEARPGMLAPEESAVFAPVVETLRESYKVPCTGCNYCMPCPHGVNIPGCFSSYNARYALGFVAGFTQYVTSANVNDKDKKSIASKCVKCGACEKLCPQHIKIIDSLAAVKRKMEPWWFSPILWLVRKIMS
ncbi:MAG: aldo/keto reductase [Oscillospiraceae bacterium]|nr:aldo/keto reductase [Oscillospiraceae bacterium]MCL2125396.1 aldo/keto reductase [Oscillospiraceae bacterium]